MTTLFTRQRMPIVATIVVFAALYIAGVLRYGADFASWTVFLNLFRGNAPLGIAAIGMTFVILTGGIDLSVGAIIGFTTVVIATLVTNHEISPAIVIPFAILLGTLFGAAMGVMIVAFELPPFLVTLAGMFFARGMALVISDRSIPINHDWYDAVGDFGFEVFPLSVATLVFATALATIALRWTTFGRTVYAIGGDEESARLMGLCVAPVKVGVYAISGFCAAVAGSMYISGFAHAGTMLELDAIAAVVVGGTPLSGGVGTAIGTLVGVLIFGVIDTAVAFEGTLNTWWTKIVIGGLLLAFILLQKLIQARATRS
ncbi:MAG: sugar ABC transporter permease YjfF [Phycisphaerales bacterium]